MECIDALLGEIEGLLEKNGILRAEAENLKNRIAELESAKKRRPALTIVFPDKSTKIF
jgi:regulator of replication initiation timing